MTEKSEPWALCWAWQCSKEGEPSPDLGARLPRGRDPGSVQRRSPGRSTTKENRVIIQIWQENVSCGGCADLFSFGVAILDPFHRHAVVVLVQRRDHRLVDSPCVWGISNDMI